MAKLGMHLDQLISEKLIEISEENQEVSRYNILFGTHGKWIYLVKDKLSNLWFLESKDAVQSKQNDLYMLDF